MLPATQRWLLALAREAITTAFNNTMPRVDDPPREAKARRACFVTLTRHGALRGCIGSLTAQRPLYEDVIMNARAAAFHDPRFPPLSPDELPHITIELSVLTPPQPVAFDPRHPETLRGKGVVLSKNGRSATFLPSVWEQLPTPEEFLSQLCIKAGLPPDEWRRGVSIQSYTAEKFSEAQGSIADNR